MAALVTAATSVLAAAFAAAAPGPNPASETPIAPPSQARGATVARLVKPLRGRTRLDHPTPTRPISVQTSWSRRPTTLLVLAAANYRGRGWVKLLLPSRPDGSAAWVPREFVVTGHSPYWIAVSTGHRKVNVYREGHLVRRFPAVVGKPSTPTPHGLAAIYERDRQSNPHQDFEGAWILSLTILSNALKHFEGGPGRIGIHGRGGASLLDPLGSARSHGCVRVSNGPVRWIAAHVPVGTPVKITG